MKQLGHFYKSLFIAQRFYLLLIGVVVIYMVSFFLTFLQWPAFLFSLLLVAVTLVDMLLLFIKGNAIKARRKLPEMLSNGDENHASVQLTSRYPFAVYVKIIDELPVQFQERKFLLSGKLEANSAQQFPYTLRPMKRGEYAFGSIHTFVSTTLRLLERRVTAEVSVTVPCYPSYIQMRKFQLLAATNRLNEVGAKQVRRVGHSLEFEQIKEYVPGDDYRTVNWKASSRRNNTLMVNNYADERSQPVYCIINAGRVMKMPFDNMTLLDYAVNASLVISSVALTRHDKAGLITYGDRWLHLLPAERTRLQMSNILYRLYNLQTNFAESNIEKLYYNLKVKVPNRSLLIYFTNYETIGSLKRDLPFLRMLNKNHLLLVVLFENTELKSLLHAEAKTVEQVYTKIVAEKFAFEKRLIAKEFQQYGIQSIITSPKDLTINTINKYLELKARQAI